MDDLTQLLLPDLFLPDCFDDDDDEEEEEDDDISSLALLTPLLQLTSIGCVSDDVDGVVVVVVVIFEVDGESLADDCDGVL